MTLEELLKQLSVFIAAKSCKFVGMAYGKIILDCTDTGKRYMIDRQTGGFTVHKVEPPPRTLRIVK